MSRGSTTVGAIEDTKMWVKYQDDPTYIVDDTGSCAVMSWHQSGMFMPHANFDNNQIRWDVN